MCRSQFLDEIVKGLLPGREFDFVDMRFDFIGYAIGMMIFILAVKMQRHTLVESKNE